MAELFGRDRELNGLLALLDDVRSGRGRAALVLGEAGIGKTRLTEGLAAAAADTSLTVAWGRCTETEAPPYWPWRQALRAVRGTASRALTAEDSRSVRDALFAAVAGELEAATAEGPAVIVVEDIHWADASSLALLRFVIGVLPDLPLLLVLTARDDPLELTEAAAVALRDLPPAVHRVPLGGLDRKSTEAIVRRVCGADVPTAFVREVYERTGGNPFFVQEVATLRALHGERSGFPVPPGVRHVLGRRLARLSQPAHEVLAIGSVMGDELEPELLELVTEHSHAKIRALLDEAERSRLVVRRDDALVFAHPLVRETLYEAQSHAVRSDLHGSVAEALEAQSVRRGQPADGLDAQLAAHWLRAPGDDARRRGGRHALAAARDAMNRMAYEQATRYFRWALGAEAGDRLTLALELGEAQVLAGELTSGRATLAEAAAMALRARRGDDLARAVLAMGGGIGGFEVAVGDSEQIRLLQQALYLLPEVDGSLRAAVLGRLSVTSAAAASEERRISLARESASMAQRMGDVRVEVAALAAYCDAIAGPDHVDERLTATDRMLELTRTCDDPTLTLLARRIRVVALLERGHFALADDEIAGYASVAERLRLPLYLWPVPIWHGMRALMCGDLDLAWRYSEETEELARRAESVNADLMVFTLRAAHAMETGQTQALAERFHWAAATAGDNPVAACMVAAMAYEADPQFSRHMFERARANGIQGLPRDSEWLEAVWQFGESGIRYGDADMVQSAYDALVPYADLWAIDGIGAACFGVIAHQLGRMAAWLSRRDEARQWLRHALERHREAEADLPVAHTERELAGLGHVWHARPLRAEQGDLHRDGRVWRVQWRGESGTVPDSKGMRDLATLLASPGRDLHVLDLVETGGGPAAHSAEGNAGPSLDRQARDAYRQRLIELEQELTQAEERHDTGLASALRDERDFLAAELAAALGLGGRDRLAGDRVERARKAVAMRIETAIRAITEVHPTFARHLRASVATGRFCVYRPEDPVTWRL